MKIRKMAAVLLSLSLLLTACAGDAATQAGDTTLQDEQSTQETAVESVEESTDTLAGNSSADASGNSAESESAAEQDTTAGSNILIAYFTRLDNTDADLDAIVQGGGPYGEIGDSFAAADMDAISSASVTVMGEDIKGNTQAVAEMIQELTGADLFSIRTVETYPVDYDELIDAGGDERNTDARPELMTQVENMEDYDIVFLGFPNWWYDMPMAIYSFLEAYDFSGKRVIPFATSAGSGFSNTISSLQNALPEAQIEENGLHVPMREAAGAASTVEEWVSQLELDIATGENADKPSSLGRENGQ